MKPAQLGAEPYAPGPNRMQDLMKIVKDSGGKASIDNEFLVGYVPGMQPQRFDIDHSAKLIPAGADLVFEVHYTTNGQETEDQTRLGLELAMEPPERQFLSIAAAQMNLTMPAGDPNAEAVAKLTFAQPVDFVYMQPHMHLRGKDHDHPQAFIRPAESETLLSVPNYDFHWQIVYYEEKPIHMPKGTRLELTAHWDNSANNKWNPDPTATVSLGRSKLAGDAGRSDGGDHRSKRRSEVGCEGRTVRGRSGRAIALSAPEFRNPEFRNSERVRLRGVCSCSFWIPRSNRYFSFGGYFSSDFLTMSSSLPSILLGSLFSSLAMVRHTRERVVGSRRSMTSVPSVNGTSSQRACQRPRHPAG